MRQSELNIKPIPERYVMLFKKQAGKVIQIREDGKTNYLGAFKGNKLIGFVGYMEMGNQIRLKADYVIPSERGNGVYRELSEYRMKVVEELAIEKGIKKISCFSSKMSRGTFKALGFKEVKQIRERTAYMEKQI